MEPGIPDRTNPTDTDTGNAVLIEFFSDHDVHYSLYSMHRVLDTLFLKFLHRAPLYLAQYHNGHGETIDIQELMFCGSIQLCKNKMVVVGWAAPPSPLFNDQRQVEMHHSSD